MAGDLVHRSAREVVAALVAGDVSTAELLDAVEARIDAVDPMINALPTRCFERARAHAGLLADVWPDDTGIGGRGILAGLPIPIKDLTPVAGVRNTFGSLTLADNIPSSSDVLVEHLEHEGAVVYAMSNVPEFGAGGNTFNDVFGPTRNPHDLRLTAGGSSGGAAAALASGMAWLAHGSDLAGSLRTPASFCGVTSLRPSPGLIATGPTGAPFFVHPQQGPMARDVADLALFADAMCGESPMVGLGKPRAAETFRQAASRPAAPSRVAFSLDLGITETSLEVAEVCRVAMTTLERDGIDVIEAHPDLSEAALAFDVPRALLYAMNLGDDLPQTRDILKPELVWNVEQGLELEASTIRDSLAAQGRVFGAAAAFMADFDLLICPAAITPPFPIEERYLGFGDGVPASEYYRWLGIVSAVTATTLPVITIPCGRTANGLPIGIQLIGRPHGELALFAMAAHLEAIFEQPTGIVTPAALA